MAAFTLEEARKHLEAWKKADLALSQGRSYQIGTRSLTRVDLKDVREQIEYFARLINQLESTGRARSPRLRRVVPIDG